MLPQLRTEHHGKDIYFTHATTSTIGLLLAEAGQTSIQPIKVVKCVSHCLLLFCLQQDAEECWTNLMYALREKVKVCLQGLFPVSSSKSVTLSLSPSEKWALWA